MPTFETHKIVDGLWVPKTQAPATPQTGDQPQVTKTATGGLVIRSADWGQPQSTPATPATQPAKPKQPIGFVPAKPVTSPVTLRCLSTKSDYLREIRRAAGKVLLLGGTPEATKLATSGRFGSRKDNLATLQRLLAVYDSGCRR